MSLMRPLVRSLGWPVACLAGLPISTAVHGAALSEEVPVAGQLYLGLQLMAREPGLMGPVYFLDAVELPGAMQAVDEDDALSDAPPTPAASKGTPASETSRAASVQPPVRAANWSRVPITWRGNLSSYSSWSRDSSGQKQTAFNKALQLDGESYIYAPWLARFNGGLTLSQTDFGGAATTHATSHGESLSLNLFPLSRFPFGAGVSLNTTTAGRGSAFTSDRYNLSQAYRPQSGAYSVSGLFERLAFGASADASSNVVDRFSANHTLFQLPYGQTLVSTLNAVYGRPSSGINRTQSYDWRTAHTANLYEDYGLTLNNDLSYTYSNSSGDPKVGGSGFHARYGYAQAGSQWEPYEDVPLKINSSLIHSATDLSAGGGVTTFDITSLLLNASYNYGKYVIITATGRADYTRTNTGTHSIYSFLGNVQSAYGVGQLKEADLGKFRYTLSYSANGGVSARTDGTSSPFVGGSLTQALARSFDVGYGLAEPLLFNASQTYGTTWNFHDPLAKTLTTNAGLQWQRNAGIYSASSRLQATDGRTYGVTNPSWYESLSWDNSGRRVLSPVSSLSGSLAVSWSRQGLLSAQGTVADWRGSGTGSLTYTNNRLFDVPRLIYNARYTLFFLPGILPGGSSQTGIVSNTHAFSQDASYQIGLLSLGLAQSSSFSAGHANHSLYFTINRALSGVL